MASGDKALLCRLERVNQSERMQETELAAMRWFDLKDVEAMPIFRQGIFRTILECCNAYLNNNYSGLTGTVLPNSFTSRSDLLLHGPHVGQDHFAQDRHQE